VQVEAKHFGFAPALIQVTAGEPVPARASLRRPRARLFDPRLKIDVEIRAPVMSSSPYRPARGALRNRLLRILRQRARTNESSARERGGHAGQSLNTERMDVMRRFTFAAGLAALTLGLGACGSG
jgi:hypothetical protein